MVRKKITSNNIITNVNTNTNLSIDANCTEYVDSIHTTVANNNIIINSNPLIVKSEIYYKNKYSEIMFAFKIIAKKYLKSYKFNYIKPRSFFSLYNDKFCLPFWKDKHTDISTRLFMPTADNIVLNTSNPIINTTRWFDSEIYDKININVLTDNIEQEPVNEKEIIYRTRRISLFLNKEQRFIIKEFTSIYRYLYNRTIQYIKNYNKETNTSFYYTQPSKKLGKIIIEIDKIKPYDRSFLRTTLKMNLFESKIDYPCHLKDQAIFEALDNFSKCVDEYKLTGKKFTMHYKSKKDKIHTINIEKSTISAIKNCVFPGYKYNGKNVFQSMTMNDKINKYNKHTDSSISYNHILDEYVLNLTYEANTQECKTNKVCSIDEGEYNFVTVYSDDKVMKLGIRCRDKLIKFLNESDIIRSRRDSKTYHDKNGKIYTVNSKRKRSLTEALHRKNAKITNMVEEMHNQIANYLTSNYSVIYLPPFESQKMVETMYSKTARMMDILSSYQFKLTMRAKCEERNCKLIEKEEYYTSKTCTRCGNLKHDLKNKRVYECEKCKIVIERDYVGARNIMLRNHF